MPKASRAASSASHLDGLQDSVVKLTNVTRLASGRKPLKVSRRLTKAAQKHAQDMAENDYFSHTSQDGRTWDDRIEAVGYDEPAGENIAYGQDTPTLVVKAWLASPAHRRNILDRKFKRIGIGHSDRGDYWVQDFGY